MKTISSVFLALFCFASFFSCEEEYQTSPVAQIEKNEFSFFARFSTTSQLSQELTSNTTDAKWISNEQAGVGVATYFGNFSFVMCCNFCCSGIDCGKYTNGQGCFIAEDGHKLYVTFAGKAEVFLVDNSNKYAGVMRDPFFITGGTGRFLNARGEGSLESFFMADLSQIDHKWSGTIKVLADKKDIDLDFLVD